MRRLCSQCKVPVAAPPEQLAALALDAATTPLFAAHGCEACNQTGYRGRFAIYEIMPITDALRSLIVDRAPADAIREAAIEEGMETMQIAGGRYVAAGETSLEELARVLR